MKRLLRAALCVAACLVPFTAAASDRLVLERDSGLVTVDLTPYDTLFGPDYTEHDDIHGRLVPTPRATWANRPTCAYFVGESDEGRGAFRQCEGRWEGALFDTRGQWAVEGRRLVRVRSSGSCGVDDTALGVEAASAPGTSTVALSRASFFEVTLVTDSRLAARAAAGESVPDPVMAAFNALVLFDGTPFERPVQLTLVGVVTYDDSTPWGAPSFEPTRAGGLLNRFNRWLEGRPEGLLNRDAVVLMTGWDFFGSTVGLANVSSACDLGTNGALVYAEGNLPSVAQTLAHELGHTIGMWHDGNGNLCPSEGFVMQAVYSADGPFPGEFSTCSISSANAFLGSSAGTCIAGDASPSFPEPRCGDGRVEGDEACDCGPGGCDGLDPCCDGATCQLRGGAKCAASDGCCDPTTCAPRPAADGFVCRPGTSNCDVDEVCLGGSRCPDDAIAPTGLACRTEAWVGVCYLGDCVTRGEACEAIAPLYRFDDPPYAEMCGGEQAGCRIIECLANGTCVLTEDAPPDGAECGAGSQCFNGDCLASDVLPSPECLEVNDDDGDGVDACGADADACPTDPEKTAPGACGCLVAESDCGEPEVDAGDTSRPDGGSDEMTDAAGEVVVIGEPNASAEGSGCTTASSVPAELSLLFFGIVAFRSRRRRGW